MSLAAVLVLEVGFEPVVIIVIVGTFCVLLRGVGTLLWELAARIVGIFHFILVFLVIRTLHEDSVVRVAHRFVQEFLDSAVRVLFQSGGKIFQVQEGILDIFAVNLISFFHQYS